MSVKVLYDEATGIYKSDYALKPPSKSSFYNRVMADVSFNEQVPIFIECTKVPRSITNSTIKLQAQQLGLGLLENVGLKPGQIIMLVCGNCIEFPVVLLAAAFAGLKIALANPAYSAKELQHVISITKPEKILMKTPFLRKLLTAKVPWNKLITIDTAIGRGGALYMKDVMVSKDRAIKAKAVEPPSLDETQILPFSSGTTGLPKSVEVSHRNLVAMLDSILTIPNGVGSVQRQIAVLPFYHAYALLMNVLIPLCVRATVWVLPPPFNPVKYCEVIEKERIQALSVVPPLFIVLTNTPQANKETFKSVRFLMTGAAPLDPETQMRLVDKTGVEVRSGWGMTETTVAGLGCHGDVKMGTCGKPIPGLEAMCVDVETGKAVKRGERGELWVRAPNVVKVR
jgi:4-coumarate--CoA ligase